jgi:uncharacterized protein YxeA
VKNKERKTIILLIIIFIIILISLYSIAKKQDLQFQDDLIFFKLWNSQTKYQEKSIEKNNKETKQYKIKVSNKTPSYKSIDLLSTIDTKTLVNEKIAPGTKGNFEIILTSNCTLKYKIEFIDKNQKPQNFKFHIYEGSEGEIQEKETKKILVDWEWKYETSTAQNKQDTRDGKNLKQYNFEICIIGE